MKWIAVFDSSTNFFFNLKRKVSHTISNHKQFKFNPWNNFTIKDLNVGIYNFLNMFQSNFSLKKKT